MCIEVPIGESMEMEMAMEMEMEEASHPPKNPRRPRRRDLNVLVRPDLSHLLLFFYSSLVILSIRCVEVREKGCRILLDISLFLRL